MSTSKMKEFLDKTGSKFKEAGNKIQSKKDEIKSKIEEANRKNKIKLQEFFKLGEQQVTIDQVEWVDVKGRQTAVITPTEIEEVQVSAEVEQQLAKTAIQGFAQAVEQQVVAVSDNNLLVALEDQVKTAVDERAPQLIETAITKEIDKQIKELAKLAKECEINTELKKYLQHPAKHMLSLIKLAKTDTNFCKLFKHVYVKLPANFDLIGKLMIITSAIGERVGTSFGKSLCAKVENILLLAKPIKSIVSVCATLVSPPILSFGVAIVSGTLTGIYNTVFKAASVEAKKTVSKKDQVSGVLQALGKDFKEILKIERENINCISDTIIKGTSFMMQDRKCSKYLGIMFNVVTKPVKAVVPLIAEGAALYLAAKSCFYKYVGKIIKATATSVTQIALDFVAHEGKDQLLEHKKYLSLANK